MLVCGPEPIGDMFPDPNQGFAHYTTLDDRLAMLEGRTRPRQAGRPVFSALCQGMTFKKLVVVSRLQPTDETLRCQRWLNAARMFLTGMNGARAALIYGVVQIDKQLQVFYGSSDHIDGIERVAKTAWAGVGFEPLSSTDIGLQLDNLPEAAAGFGLPVDLSGSDQEQPFTETPMDRVVRAGLYGPTPWALVVVCYPIRDDILARYVKTITQEIRTVNIQFFQDNTPDRYNRGAKLYLDALEAALTRMQKAQSNGGWAVVSYVLAAPGEVQSAAGSILAALSGSSTGEPFRLVPCAASSQGFQPGFEDVTFLSSNELSSLAHPPLDEYPGYNVRETVRLAVDPPRVNPEQPKITIGFVRDENRPTGGKLEINVSSLTKHAFITGVTGSGKTNTSFELISQLWKQHRIPFLVLEPAKGEYGLLEAEIPELQIYRLGDPTLNLSLNPFSFTGVRLHTHLDLIKTLFSASFVLYPPMPYILEHSLHEVYTDRGWDLAGSGNWRTDSTHLRSWPTLDDLYNKVAEVTRQAGYDSRIQMDVQAGLQVRLANLKLGAKGQLLNARRPTDLKQLLERPTIIDMSGIGDDEQRAFVLGLMILELYEHCAAIGWQAGQPTLRHVILIEEAHRLLRNVAREASAEVANPQGRAIETFANLLAEIRAYGVGLVVVEQIPSKLSPEVLKNTGLKIAHRLVDYEERTLMGGALGLNEAQAGELARLQDGEAIVYPSGTDRPLKVKMPGRKGRATAPNLAGAAQAIQPDMIADLSIRLSELPVLKQAVAALILSAIEAGPSGFAASLHKLVELVRQVSPLYKVSEQQQTQLVIAIVTETGNGWLSRLGGRYAWPFELEEELLADLKRAVGPALQGNPAGLDVKKWQSVTHISAPPFATCVGHCQSVCRYRAFIDHLVDEAVVARLSQLLTSNPKDSRWASVAHEAMSLAASIVYGSAAEMRGAAACTVIHLAQRYSQLQFDREQIVTQTLSVIDKGLPSRHEN